MTGPHKRRGAAQTVLKALVIGAVLLALLVMSTWMVWEYPRPKEEPSASILAYARNLYNMTGYNGEAKIYIDRWPEYAGEIMGK